jgi:hypothetical protein
VADKLITQDELKRLLEYLPDKGRWFWREKPSPKSSVRVGQEAALGGGHRRIKIHGRTYLAARLAFLFMEGRWPVAVDHRNDDPADDRWTNLREVTHAEVCRKRRPRSNTQVGLRGVCQYRRKFAARVRYGGKLLFIGAYDTAEDAAQAYQQTASKLFGEFYRS